MPLQATEQGLQTGFSDMLFFQQMEVVYVLVVAMMTAGVLLWLFGGQVHRIVVTVLALAVGIVAGWALSISYGVEVMLGMTAGAVVGATLGYWLFRFWLGVFSSWIICMILVGLYGFVWARPYLQAAARSSRTELVNNGITLLEPVPATQPDQPTSQMTDTPLVARTDGQAYRNLVRVLPRLTRGHYTDWDQWREHFGRTVSVVIDNLSVLVPRLKLELALIAGVSVILGMVLAFLKPDFLNVVYTSAVGTLMTVAGIAILLSVQTTTQSRRFWANRWAFGLAMVLMVLVGAVVQYYLYPRDAEEAEEDEEEEPEQAKPTKSGRSRKK